MIDVALFLAYALIGVCAITAVGMPLVKAFGDPQSLKKMGTGVGVVLVVFIISYVIADGTASENASAGAAKMVGAGLITMYIMAFLAIGGIVFTEIQKMLE